VLTRFFRIPICPGGWRDWPTGWQRLPSIWKRPASGLGFLPSASRSRPSTFAIAVIYTHKQTHIHTRTHAQRDKDRVNISAVNRMPNSSSSVARDKLKAKFPCYKQTSFTFNSSSISDSLRSRARRSLFSASVMALRALLCAPHQRKITKSNQYVLPRDGYSGDAGNILGIMSDILLIAWNT